jgi:hypothetical protein
MIPDPLALSQVTSIHTAWHLLYEGLIPKTCEGADLARSRLCGLRNRHRLVH